MTEATTAQRAIVGTLNFAGDRSGDGVWSNYTPEIRTQNLAAHAVPIVDARQLDPPASLDCEGFALAHLPVGEPDWENRDWIEAVYIPRSLDLVKTLARADHVAPFFGGQTILRDTGEGDVIPAADFIHLDQTRGSIGRHVDMAADETTLARFPHVQLFNLWRPTTPPPQDVPLALCDQRSMDEADWVFGRTVEPTYPQGAPYTTSLFDERQRWHYFSDLTPDDVIVFRQYDSHRDNPMGCLHGAFVHPGPLGPSTPRASIELRIFAFSRE